MRLAVADAVLELRLLAQVLERARLHRRRAALLGGGGERGDGRDALLLEPVRLVAAQPGDERQVVVRVPLRLAARQEVADLAVRDRQRVGRRLRGEPAQEALAHAPVVGTEVDGPERLALARAEQHVHPLRLAPLDARDLLGVEAELEDVRRLRVPRELRVGDLVAPRAEVGRRVDALEEVREPAPAAVEQDGLVDDVDAGAHRVFRSRGRRARDPTPRRRRARCAGRSCRRRAATGGRQPRARRPCGGSARRTGSRAPAARPARERRRARVPSGGRTRGKR